MPVSRHRDPAVFPTFTRGHFSLGIEVSRFHVSSSSVYCTLQCECPDRFDFETPIYCVRQPGRPRPRASTIMYPVSSRSTLRLARGRKVSLRRARFAPAFNRTSSPAQNGKQIFACSFVIKLVQLISSYEQKSIVRLQSEPLFDKFCCDRLFWLCRHASAK